MLSGLALVWSEELVRGRSGRPLNCDLLMAAEPRRQSVVRVVTVDFFYRRAPAYSAELKPDRRANSRLSASLFADAVGLLAVPAGRYKGARFLDHPVEDPDPAGLL